MTPIAIIGIGCRLPGGVKDAGGYWQLLADGRCALSEIPAERWGLASFYDPAPDRPDRSYCKWGGFLDDIRSFDPQHFGLSPREAAGMDPQQRLLLQVAVEAIEDAMVPVAALRKARAGVFIGVSNVDYNLLQRYRHGVGEIQAGTGTALSIVANRVSNRLDLSGPSMGIDTACSSSLVAVDTACRHLADGSCGMALAGGVNILIDPRMFITFSRAHMLSATGRIRAFDAAADGFVRGEGVGVVVLKRLDEAIRAGDRIYAVIEATAVNQDGATGTITQPSLEAQIAMLGRVAEVAGIGAGDVDYVEAHGTGTPVGDPIEANAIGAVLGGAGRGAPLPIGSSKTNIGHLEPAAGIAGLIKAALVIHKRRIPPSLGFETANPAIPMRELNLCVATRCTELGVRDRAARAVVNSFGFGGTNACAVIASTPERNSSVSVGSCTGGRSRIGTETTEQPGTVFAVPLSGPTRAHLQRHAAALAAALNAGGAPAAADLRTIAAALSARYDAHEHRAVVLAASTAELGERLACLADGREWPQADRRAAPQIVTGRARAGRKVVFTMTGQGGQWWAMGRELLTTAPVFRDSITEFDAHFAAFSGWSAMKELTADERSSRIDDAAITPAVMFALQSGLANVWRSLGVRPDIVLGHSFGEVTAAYLAGAITPKSVARLVTHRGRIRGAVDRVGTMAAIGLGAEEITGLLPDDGSIEIGGYNAPNMVTLSGEEAAIDRLIARLQREQPAVLARKLALDFAYHSSWFDPVEAIFKDDVGVLETAAPQLPVISTVTGSLNDRFDADYWWQNLRRPVLYQAAVEHALAMGADTFVELGPHRTLSAMTQATAAAKGSDVLTVTTLDRQWGDAASIAVAASQLWVAGIDIDWSAMHGADERGLELPRRPWIEQQLWTEPQEARQILSPTHVHPLLGRPEAGPGQAWGNTISLASHPWLAEHRIDGAVVFPAAGYLEMLVVAGRHVLGTTGIELSEVVFPSALYLGSDDELELATMHVPEIRRLTIRSRLRGGSGDWQLRAQAVVHPAVMQGGGAVDDPRGRERVEAAKPVATADFYAEAERCGYGWHGSFRSLSMIETRGPAASGRIEVDDSRHGVGDCVLEPRALDAAMQLMVIAGREPGAAGMRRLMPTGIRRIVVAGGIGRRAAADLQADGGGDGSGRRGMAASIRIRCLTSGGHAVLHGITTRPRGSTYGADDAGRAKLYLETMVALEHPPVPAAGGRQPGEGDRLWVAASNDPAAVALARRLAGGRRTDTVHVTSASRPDCNDLAAALTEASGNAATTGIVLAICSPGRTADDTLAGQSLLAEACTGLVVHFGQAIAAAAKLVTLPPIRIVTCGRCRDSEPAAGPIDGVVRHVVWPAARAIAMELPDCRIRLIDADDGSLETPITLDSVLDAYPAETEIVLRDGKAQVPRLTEIESGERTGGERGHVQCRSTPSRHLGPERNFTLRRAGPAGPGALAWQMAPRATPGAGEIELEVHAAGLNFRDVLAVNGMLPDGAEPGPALEALGLEFAGVVRRVGADVTGFAAGDRVFGMARGTLRRFATVPAHAAYRIPAALSDAQAATIASAYLTAHAALEATARLERGETVLIHSAAGGVGMAAIAIAEAIGARIIATAGTEEKRAHLRALGIPLVLDSRNLAFADQVMEATDGRGVDVALNVLQGAFLDKTLACMAPYGRFVELGKRDVYGDSAIGMRRLAANISLHVVDLAAMIEQRPQRVRTMMMAILERIEAAILKPLPCRDFAAGDVQAAFRAFSNADHIGKIAVSIDSGDADVRHDSAGGIVPDGGGCYLVTGGTRGFGLTVARWLARRGAGRVIVASRSGKLEAGGAGENGDRLEPRRLDVTDAEAVNRLVGELVHDVLPLRGIVHAAVTYDDALIEDVTGRHVAQVLGPKLTGAVNLTRAVLQHDARLDWLVSFSSLARVVGWPAQSTYAAANGALAWIAGWQRAHGLPGLAIDWGALAETGHVARSSGMLDYLEAAGWRGIATDEALKRMADALALDTDTVMIAAADWPKLAASHRAIGAAGRLAGLTGATGGRTSEGRTALAGLGADARHAAALGIVREQAAKVLRTDFDALVGIELLADAGIDSLSTFELRSRIETETGIALPLDRFTKAQRFSELAALVAAVAGVDGPVR